MGDLRKNAKIVNREEERLLNFGFCGQLTLRAYRPGFEIPSVFEIVDLSG